MRRNGGRVSVRPTQPIELLETEAAVSGDGLHVTRAMQHPQDDDLIRALHVVDDMTAVEPRAHARPEFCPARAHRRHLPQRQQCLMKLGHILRGA